MDVMGSMQDVFDRGAYALKGAVSNAAVEMQPFMVGFSRLCTDGWQQGWHERNGGNLTYRMTDADVKGCWSFFDEGTPWISLGVQVGNLHGAFFAITGAGSYMRNIQQDIAHNVGIVQINDTGEAYRVVWGLRDGGRPTSELASHVMIHSVRMQATGGASRVLYHAHPDNVIALTKIMPLSAREITRVLWKSMTECIIVFPMGVGVVPCMVPGSMEIARATSEQMKVYDATIWAQHGLFCSGPDFDTTFGLMHTIEKAARIHAQALMMNGGKDGFMNTITDNDLRAIARTYNLEFNESFLN